MRAGSIARLAPLYGGLVCGLVALAGCARQGESSSQPQTAQPSEPTHQDFGAYQVHYNAVRTDMLSAEIARAYSIERSRSRVLLNVAMLSKAADGSTTPVDGVVAATAYNLNGQLKDLAVRRISEGAALYFIGEVGISGSEILVFNIAASPQGSGDRFEVQFKREFFTD